MTQTTQNTERQAVTILKASDELIKNGYYSEIVGKPGDAYIDLGFVTKNELVDIRSKYPNIRFKANNVLHSSISCIKYKKLYDEI